MKISDITFAKYGLDVRLLDEADATFICRLRSNRSLNKFISPTSENIVDQINWIKKYKERERALKEFYFIFSVNGISVGLERIYNLTECDFTFGSLIFDVNAPAGAAILGDIITKEYGYNTLGFNLANFDVRKENKSVVKYHQSYNPSLVDEDELNYFFTLTKTNFEIRKKQLLKILLKDGN